MYDINANINIRSTRIDFKNVEYKYDVFAASSTNYIGVGVLSNVAADIVFDCGEKIEYKAKNTTDEISVTDKNGNMLLSVEDSTSSVSYITVFENSMLRIAIRYGESTGIYFYVVHKVDNTAYKLSVASADMNMVRTPTLNK